MKSSEKNDADARISHAGNTHSLLGPTLTRWFVFPIFLSAAFWQRLIGSHRERRSGVWSTRLQYRLFFLGAPALLVLTAAAIAGAMHYFSRDSLPATYANQGESALQEERFALASLCIQRALAAFPDDRRLRYRLATAYVGQGNVEAGLALMYTLAPSDDVGFPPAQVWLVRRALSSPEPITPAELREIESRLIRLRSHPEVGSEAAALLADVYFQTGRARLVMEEPALAAAAESTPALRLSLTRARLARRDSAGKSVDQLRIDAEQLAAQFRRDLAKDPDNARTRLRLAEALLLLEDFGGADVVLREGLTLVPDDRRLAEALVQAACGRVDQLVAQGAPLQTIQAPARAARDVVERYAPESEQRSLATAKLLGLEGKLDEAIPLYVKLLDKSPYIRMELAELLSRHGRLEEARSHYAKLLEGTDPEKPPADLTLCLLYGTAARRLERFEAARAWFTPSAVKMPAAQQLLVETLISGSDRLPATRSTEKLELLREAVRRSPQSLDAWQRLLAMSVGDATTADEARRTLADMIATGEAGAGAYALLGTHALQQGDEAAARKYLEQAERLDPKSTAVLNNLAWLLAFGKQPDLPRALDLADAAALKHPKDPHIRDTRGRILAKMERWNEALADLEICRQTYDSDPSYHHVIADVYEHLGLAAPADAHRRREQELQAKKPPEDVNSPSPGKNPE